MAGLAAAAVYLATSKRLTLARIQQGAASAYAAVATEAGGGVRVNGASF